MARWDYADLLDVETKAFSYPEYSDDVDALRKSAIHHKKVSDKLYRENLELKKQLLKYQEEELERAENLDRGY